jgi:hypothetical protein
MLRTCLHLLPFAFLVACVGDSPVVSPPADGGPTPDSTPGADASKDASADTADAYVPPTYTASLADMSKWSFHTINTMPRGGVVASGNYVYFVGSNIVQYDIGKPFADDASFLSYAASSPVTGGVAIGGVIVFFPIYPSPHAFVRYDSAKPITSAAAWSSYGVPYSPMLAPQYNQGGAFDGKYVYAPSSACGVNISCSTLTRYDVGSTFNQAGSWSNYDMSTVANQNTYGEAQGAGFDGRYLYMPTQYRGVIRYDTNGSRFDQTTSYSTFDTTIIDKNVPSSVSAVFDGRFMYFSPAPGSGSLSLRFDTTKDFMDVNSWEKIDLSAVDRSSAFRAGSSTDGTCIMHQTTRPSRTSRSRATSSASTRRSRSPRSPLGRRSTSLG